MKTEDMIFPCCRKKLPAPLDGVELAICSCGQEWKPATIIIFNMANRHEINKNNGGKNGEIK